MAEVFRRAGGVKITKIAALHIDTQMKLLNAVDSLAITASRVLRAHRHDGHARIEQMDGDIDHYLVLSDERGQAAAMTIEFGRKGDTRYQSGDKKGLWVEPMEPVAPLRIAAGYGIKKVGPKRAAS